MGRAPRIDFPGARHHVMNRGRHKDDVFLERACRPRFLAFVAELPERFGLEVHAYALMPNHYHLLLRSCRANLSEAMRWLGSRYTRTTNERWGWDGTVFRGRFRNRLVGDDAHWKHLFAYVHANPERSGFDRERSRGWTSRGPVLEGAAPPWLSTDELFRCFGSVTAYLAYERALVAGEPVGPSDFEPARLWAPGATGILGPRGPLARPSFDEALRAVGDLVGRSPEALLAVDAGCPYEQRWLATWWLAHGAGIGQSGLARRLGVSQQAVNRRVRKLERARATDRRLDAMMRALARRLLL